MTEAGMLEIRAAVRGDAPAISTLLHRLGHPQNNEEEVVGRLAQ